jgi:molybdate transport system ATP-binding protein
MIRVHQARPSEEQTPSKAAYPARIMAAPGTLTVEVRRYLAGFTLDIAFSVPRGLTVLFGPSGAGKSMTLQAIAGLCPLDSATILLDGAAWHDSQAGVCLPPQQRHVGYVPQNYALFPHLTVEQNIAFGLKARGKQARQRVSELIRLMQLDGLERQRPAQLSGGQQQRVALARALATDPHLLLLDEPFSSLDAAVRETLREEMRAFHERVHVPIVLVTHDALEARMLADTVVVMQNGRVLQVGTQQTIFRSPQTRAVAALVGMRACWTGDVVTTADVPCTSSTAMREVVIRIADLNLKARVPAAMPVHVGQALDLGIRTDEIRVYTADAREAPVARDGEPASTMTWAPGVVIHDQMKGAFHSITVRLETGHPLEVPMIARELHDLRIGVGSQVILGIPMNAVHVFEAR